MLNVGDKAPDFELMDSNGEIIKLSKFKGKYVILYFYPKDMTPGCTKEACNFRDDFIKFKKANVEILGVSMDNQESHKNFSSKHKLPFKLLVDTNGDVCKRYDVYKQKSFFGKKFFGIKRTTFIIDKDGKIANIYKDVDVDRHSRDILNFLKIS